jgi:DNA-binding CsgD family transcriptional regulator
VLTANDLRLAAGDARYARITLDFGRSFNTINNHTRAIFTAFGVRNRAALVAQCARLGLLDAPRS